MWDGAFSLARTINPTDEEAKIYQKLVLAAVHGTRQYDSSMPHHAKSTHDAEACEMADDKYSGWGLGDKMEDWVERLHQWGMQQRRRFHTVRTPLPLFPHLHKRRQALTTPIPMCSLK